MKGSNDNNKQAGTVSLVGKQVSSTTYDEVFLNCTDGYCVFDEHHSLQAFSSDFPLLYPTIKDRIVIGMSYTEYMRAFFDCNAVRNMGPKVSADEWVHQALKIFEQESAQHTHHLHDGRWMRINMKNTSSGQRLFVAMDISSSRENEHALRQSHERYRAFAHLAMDWFWELDKDLRYIYHSGHKESLTGYNSTEIIGMSRIESIDGKALVSEALYEHNRALREHRPFDLVLAWKESDTNIRHVNIIGSPEFDKSGNFTGYMGCGREVTKEILLQSRLNYIAGHDDLTGLINRRMFESALTEKLQQSVNREKPSTLCFIDLDRFKLVNDGGGHDAGDQLLKNIANTFCEILGEKALVARLGGDEFGIILHMGINEALEQVNHLISHISSSPFNWKQRKYTIGASAGLVVIDDQCDDISVLMSHADTACYMAKNAGRNQTQIYMYDEYFQDPVSVELKQVNLLKNAMDNDGLMLYLQPIKPLQYETTHTHFEVLLRLQGSDGQIKSAGEFIPVAEKYDLMQHLDKWVLHEALRTLTFMMDKGLDVSFSINISGNTLSNKDSLNVYRSVIEESNVSSSLLTFEVTETAAIKNIETAKKYIADMKAYGCDFSLDDFGSGLSSFGYLKELSVDYLKIDGSFVKSMANDATCKAIVSAFNQLSHEMGMETVAEFVEDEKTEKMLKELGIDFAQGYGVGAPQHADVWVQFLLENKPGLKKAG